MTAEDFTNLHLQYLSTQAEGELPATIEHDFHNGRMVDHYFVTPSPNFWNDEAIRELEGVTGIMFLQQPCLLYTSPSPRDGLLSRMPSSA